MSNPNPVEMTGQTNEKGKKMTNEKVYGRFEDDMTLDEARGHYGARHVDDAIACGRVTPIDGRVNSRMLVRAIMARVDERRVTSGELITNALRHAQHN